MLVNGKKIINARVLINNNNNFFIGNAPLYIFDGMVVDSNYRCDFEEYDIHGKVIMPGMFNIHSHLGESLFVINKDVNWTIDKYLNYTESINKAMNPTERNYFWLKSAYKTVRRMKRCYTVGFCAARSSYISSKMGLLTMSGYPIMNSEKLVRYKNKGIEGFVEYYKKYVSPKSAVGVFLHSIYANDQESFELAKQCMRRGGEFLTIHVSEDYESMTKEKSIHGMTATEVLKENGLLGKNTILVHCGYVNKSDLELIKDSGASICICPLSNIFLNTKMINIQLLNEYGIPWYIGTDGLATGRTFSLRCQVNIAKKYHSSISYLDFFSSITKRPANVFNRSLYTGSIDVGNLSNFIVFDSDKNTVESLCEDFFKSDKRRIKRLVL